MTDNTANIKRWKLILGNKNLQNDADDTTLSAEEQEIDAALSALYEYEHSGKFEYHKTTGAKGSGASSNFALSKWLGDIRNYFPQSVVQVLQKDALKQPDLQRKLMFEPEILEQASPDIHLVATLLSLKKHIPAKTKTSALIVIKKVVDDLTEKIRYKTIAALSGALHRNVRNYRPKFYEMDWHHTILKNLKHYQPAYKTIIPEQKIGFGRKKRNQLKDIIICLDQSASMATSIVYAGIFANVMASLPTIRTQLLAFDTAVINLSDKVDDLVELLFGIQLGGGTDINNALLHSSRLVEKPSETLLLLISDLYEAGNNAQMQQRFIEIQQSGVQVIVLLTLSDDGVPSYDHDNAKFLTALGIPVFACTPDMFPDMMAAAISGQDLSLVF